MSNDYDFPIKRDDPPEASGVVIWENPDVPPLDKIATGEVESFACPYNEAMQSHLPTKKQCDPCDFNVDGSKEENYEALVSLIDKANGTLRCEDCHEPIYGFYADGDGNEYTS